jgi:branched-chain amino acid transport system substrate-binding protein
MKKPKFWLTALAMTVLSHASQADILIGQTAGFTGTATSIVQESTDGAKLYIDAVNAKGGVSGQKIALISLDDRFDPKLSAVNARTLIEEKNVQAMFLSFGTPHTEAIIPLLDQHAVPLVGPTSGAMILRQPVKPHVFNVRTTYQREVEKAIKHLTSVGVSRIGLVYSDDSFGADVLAGAQKSLAAAKLTPVMLEKFNRAKPDFSAMSPQFSKSGAQAVILIAAGQAVIDGVKALRATGSTAQVVILSFNASSTFMKSLGDSGSGVIMTQIVPHQHAGLHYTFVKEAQELAKAKGINNVSPVMLEGFVTAKVLVESLRRAGAKPSRGTIQAALEGMQNFDLGGLKVSYSPDDHNGLDFVDLSIIGGDGKLKR